MPAAVITISLHAIVMAILQTAYRDEVAPDSIQAMTVRLIVWAVILSLLIVQRYVIARPTIKVVPESTPNP